MGQGQKGSSDKTQNQQSRENSPGPENGNKCRVCRFPLLVALLQLLLGVAVTAVAFLTLVISPSLMARETPHWAGIIVSSDYTLFHQLLVCIEFESPITYIAAWLTVHGKSFSQHLRPGDHIYPHIKKKTLSAWIWASDSSQLHDSASSVVWVEHSRSVRNLGRWAKTYNPSMLSSSPPYEHVSSYLVCTHLHPFICLVTNSDMNIRHAFL